MLRFARNVAFQRHVLALVSAALGFLAVGCGPQHVLGSARESRAAQPAAARHGKLVTFDGMCDASGAVPLDTRHFAVVDDEDNTLRVYDAEVGGAPQAAFDLSQALALPSGGEADLEAATRIGDYAYFLSSHGRTSRGQLDPNRVAFFSLQLSADGASLAGSPYRSLLQDLSTAPVLRSYDVAGAAARGELSFEGMTATPEGSLWLGLRSPVPHGQALLLQLANPQEMMSGAAAQITVAQELDLGGRGVRGLSFWHGGYLILAGPAGDGGPFALYRWQGNGPPQLLEAELLRGLGPEGFFSHEARDEVLVLSDDGTRWVDGQRCKSLSGPERKSFRGIWLAPPRG